MLARPFVNIKDPVSGFFAMPRAKYKEANALNPIGYKIGLELVVKCYCKKSVELPIHFADRVYGENKLTLIKKLKYILYVRRLFLYEYANSSELVQFLSVGASGILVNLLVLSLLVFLGMGNQWAVAIAIAVSVCTNFLLNRRFTFSHSREVPIFSQFIKYVASVSVGVLVNYGVVLVCLNIYPDMRVQFAALIGIAVAMVFNFSVMKFIVRPLHDQCSPRPSG